MKRNLTFVLSVLALMACLIAPMGMNGQTRDQYSYEFTSDAWSGNGSATLNNVAWTLNMNGGTISSFSSTQGMHFGTNNNSCNSVSISTTGISGTITDVTVEASRGSSLVGALSVSVGGTAFYNGNSTTNSLTTSNASYAYTGSASGTIDILWTKSSGKGAYYIKKITVTYTSGGGSNLTTSDLAITSQSSALTFDLYNNSTAQTITYSTSSTGAISITPASPTSYFSYVHDANNQTITVTPIAVTPSAQTVTISQEADATYNAGSASFTVSVANSAPLANIAALTANTTAGTYNVALSNAVVTYVNGSNAYIQDASGAVLYYKSTHGLTAGDVLNGTAIVSYQLYNGNPQITDLTGVTPVSGAAPNPTTVAQSAWNYTFNNVLSQYFQITGATITQNNNKYYVSLNNESIQLYRSGTALSGLDLTKTYTITGFPTLYVSGSNTVKELQVYEVPQVEVSGPTVIVTPATLSSFTYEEGDGPSTTKTLSVEGANLTADITVSLTDGQNSDFELSLTENGTYTNTLTLTQNSGAVAATTVYVRMKAGLSVNANAYEDDITIASTGATSVTVNLTGTVTVPVGPHVTWDLSTNTFASATADLVTWSSNFATMTNAKGNSSTNANNYLGGNSTYTHTRFYQNQVLTITPATGYAITSVEINAVTSYVAGFTGNQWTNASASTSGTTVTVTPTDGSQAISVVISGACRATAVTVYYTQHVVQSYNLTVSALSNVDMFVFDYDDQSETLIEGDATAQTESVLEGTHVLVSVSAASGYALATFTVDDVDHLADIEDYEFDFIMPSHDVTITATAAPVYTIMFSVNGQYLSDMEVAQGQALGTLPVPANIPAGFTFVGWMDSPANAYYNATTAPTMVSAQTVPNDDMILDAVFCIAENEGGWTLSNTAPEDEDEVILATEVSGNYYAFFANASSASATSITVANNVITNAPETVWTASEATTTISGTSYSGLAFSREEVNGFLHFNSSAIKVANGYTNGLFEFNGIQGTSAFTMYSFLNERYLTYDNGFDVSSDEEDACPVYVFKYIAGNATYSDYTTLVVNHADNTTIADNAAETLYGIHYINGYVLAGDNVTNNGKLVVTTNGELDMDVNSIYNSNAANLIIEDGAQLIMHSQFNTVNATMQKNIVGCTYNSSNNAGYYLIASPLAVAPNAVANMLNTTDGYDLYYYDGTQPLEWINYKADGGYSLVRGKGYLYANGANATLEFAGSINTQFNGFNYLDYSANNPFGRLNLVGNPFTYQREFCVYDYNYYDGQNTPTVNANYYSINSTGDGFIAGVITNGTIALDPMEAILIQTTNTNQHYRLLNDIYVIGSGILPTIPEEPGEKGIINLNLGKDASEATIDRAIVRFDNGSMLPKFQLSTNGTKIYFTESGQEYAVVNSDAQGELPVSFKAGSNGTYVISADWEDANMSYLHLIDNKTNTDVDLLATPSYTFEANSGDNANRFRLVFDANNVEENGASTSSATFAYFNGSEWVVSNMGDATLQVIDIMGRVLSSETINDDAKVTIEQVPGVYMLRLVNGNDVKVQKVVVK